MLNIIGTKVHRRKTSCIVANPKISVITVFVLYPISGVIPPKFVTTQKQLSLAWDTVIAPVPMAIIVSTDKTSVLSPSIGSIGARIPAVVVIITVEEPCAV
jgi:hypothetical protein